MNKFITILLVFSMTLAISQSQSCSTTFAATLDVSTLQSQTASSGINFCKAIKDSNTCCSADVVNGFENKAKELLARLTASVSTRDRMIIQARKSAFAVRGALSRIQAAAPQATENLKNYTPVSDGSGSSGEMTINISDFADMATGFGQIATFLTGNITELVGGFDTFQENRKKCIDQLVNLQTASWCLACDPNQANNGVSGSSLTLHSALSQTLVDACAPFIVRSAAQNAFIGIHYISGMLNGMANGMEKIAANNIEGGINDFFMAVLSMIQSGAVSGPSSIDQTPSTLPANCDETSCDWITTKLFVNGKIDEKLLAAGGEIEDPELSSGGFSFSRLLAGNRNDDDEEEAPVKIVERKLQSGWNPDADESGIQVAFEVNPAGVVNDENSLSGFKNAIVGLSLTVLTVLFF